MVRLVAHYYRFRPLVERDRFLRVPPQLAKIDGYSFIPATYQYKLWSSSPQLVQITFSKECKGIPELLSRLIVCKFKQEDPVIDTISYFTPEFFKQAYRIFLFFNSYTTVKPNISLPEAQSIQLNLVLLTSCTIFVHLNPIKINNWLFIV